MIRKGDILNACLLAPGVGGEAAGVKSGKGGGIDDLRFAIAD
jgi:hypothetical protein